jgi:hypothetical protein
MAIILAVIWFVVVLEIVLVAVFADVPAIAWVGLAIPGVVALGLSGAAYVLLRHERPEAGLPPDERARRSRDVHRVLVVANETLPAQELHNEIARRADQEQPVEVFVVAPVLAGPVSHWTDEEDRERAQASARLDATCEALAGLPVTVSGEIGSDDPLRAIEDALRSFGADEIIVSTHPAGQSNWLEKDVVERAKEYYGLPVTHVIVAALGDAAPRGRFENRSRS